MKAPILLLTSLLLTTLLQAQQPASGVVFLDKDADMKFSQSDQPLENIPVSNGRDVVLTDANGQYELMVDDDDILFVVKPSGYEFHVDEYQLPQFYYIHKPAGSPDLDYTGVKPTGPLPESVDFALLPGDEKEEFEILLFGDPQPYTAQEVDYFDRDIVSPLVGKEGYDFGISLGDIVGDDLDLYPLYIRSVSRLGLPWHNVYGNHDMNFDADTDSLADETWEAVYGPATYSFNHGKAHFLVLDDVIYPRKDGENGYIGGFTEEQFKFVENDLKFVPKDHLVVVSFHIPFGYDEGTANAYRMDDQKRLLELLKDHPHTVSLSAHTHIQGLHHLGSEYGMPEEKVHIHYNVGTTSGDWWSGEPDEENIPSTTMRDGTPNGYAIMKVDGNEFTLDYNAARMPEEQTMSLWGPKVVPQNEWFSASLYVNYWLGNDSTLVEYRFEGEEEWRRMGRIQAEDPHIAELRVKWDSAEELITGKRPSNPILSNHLWRTRIPNNRDEGTHTMEIRVTDPYSGVHYDSFTYRIEDR